MKKVISILIVFIFCFTVSCGQLGGAGDMVKTVDIYKMNRTEFQQFVAQPSVETLECSGLKKHTYPKDGEWHLTYDMFRFPINKTLVDFVGSNTAVEQYLLQQNVNVTVKKVVLIDTPRVPLTAWIETETGLYCIAIQKEIDGAGYIYQFHSSSSMNEMYACKDATLVVNGKNVTTETPVKCYNNYADIPLTIVLQSLGATITKETDKLISIVIQGKKYLLDVDNTSLYVDGKEDANLLYVDGGSMFVSAIDQEVLVDSDTLSSVLYDLGIRVIIHCDHENQTVTIIEK